MLAALPVNIERSTRASLGVFAWPVGQDREAVVDRKCVVAIIDVAVHTCQAEIPVVAHFPVETGTQGSFVPSVGVFATEVRVGAEAVALIMVCTQPIARAVFSHWTA